MDKIILLGFVIGLVIGLLMSVIIMCIKITPDHTVPLARPNTTTSVSTMATTSTSSSTTTIPYINATQTQEIRNLSQNLAEANATINRLKNAEAWKNIWNIKQQANWVIYGQMLDTFSMHIQIATDKPTKLLVYSQSNGIVENFSGEYYNFYFNLSEGCDAYAYVIEGNGTFNVIPNVTAKYSPTPYLTGVCVGT